MKNIKAKNARIIKEWNDYCPPGTEVKVCLNDGSFLYTETTSAAWDICGTPSVKVKGISGGYDLDRITIP